MGPLPPVPHGSQRHKLADKIRGIMHRRGFEVTDQQLALIRDDLARRGQHVARAMGMTFPVAVGHVDAETYASMLIKQSGKPEFDPLMLHATWPVPVAMWEEFTRRCPGTRPADITGPADRLLLDWRAPMTGALVLSADLNDTETAYNLVLAIPPGSPIALALGLTE